MENFYFRMENFFFRMEKFHCRMEKPHLMGFLSANMLAKFSAFF